MRLQAQFTTFVLGLAIMLLSSCSWNETHEVVQTDTRTDGAIQLLENESPPFGIFRNSKIREIGVWRTGKEMSTSLYYVITSEKQNSEHTDDGELFRVFTENNTKIYEDRATSFGYVQYTDLLRNPDSIQLVLPCVNFGGSGCFFQVLNFDQGRVSLITNEDDALYSGSAAILPQFSEPKYFSLPSQILLTADIASTRATASVLRYDGQMFREAGTIEGRALDEFINGNLRRDGE